MIISLIVGQQENQTDANISGSPTKNDDPLLPTPTTSLLACAHLQYIEANNKLLSLSIDNGQIYDNTTKVIFWIFRLWFPLNSNETTSSLWWKCANLY